MKRFLCLLLLVTTFAFVSGGYAAEKDHVPKIEKVSPSVDMEAAVVASVFSAPAPFIEPGVHALSLLVVDHSPPAGALIVTTNEKKRSLNSPYLIPRIRDRGVL